ncbi:1-phosphatidylinositol-3-phosphate 5-kinase [Gigaspora margarita]|uniref:1-phosphatidylinositol-3-phosphate 5-kinase n=1 Tax=Gigaspora margarita TaxID=4874 RepID=A0A8H3XH00_GIGMA|nr:1-phosphatidylinositol-3-phosphate 5-kinase [Gigaspora margarita]
MTSVRLSNNSLSSDVATLTSFGYRPCEEDNENVISKLFQRVRSSFVVSPGTSNITNCTDLFENSSTNSSQDPEFEPSKSTSSLLLPDKDNKGFKTPAPPVISIEPFLGSAPPKFMVETSEGVQEHINGTINGINTTTTTSNLTNGVSNQQNHQDKFDSTQDTHSVYKDASDTRSIHSIQTTASTSNNSGYSFSKVIRRLRGEGVNKGYWMADDTCKECYECKTTFTIVRRKHHCRICGQIFCAKCASNIIPGEKFNYDGAMRVCNFCRHLMEDYGDNSDAEPDHWTTEKNDFPNNPLSRSQSILTDNHIIPSSTTSELTPTLNAHLSPRPPSPDALSLNDFGLKRITSLFMSRSRSNTINEDPNIITSISSPSPPAPFRRSLADDDKNTPAANPEAVLDPEIAPFMSDEEGEDDVHYDSLTNPSNVLNFVTSFLHVGGNNDSATPTPAVSEYAGSDDEVSEYGSRSLRSIQRGQRADELRSQFARDKSASRRRSTNNSRASRMSKRSGLLRQINPNNGPMEISCSIESRPSSPFSLRHSRTTSIQAKTEISSVSLQHMRQLLRQFLRESEIDLSEGWEDVIMDLMTKVSDNLNPNVRNGDEIDIRHYVKIKRIPGGTPQDSEYIHGVVCSKNLAHKQMPRIIQNPRVLILTFALEYHRVENQLMSLDPVIAQEEEHLRLLVNRIAALRPHLVLVEKTVARKALQMLLEKNVAVALNVKPSVIEAVARCARADVIQSIDKLALEPKLGNCGTFLVKTFDHQLIPGRRKTYLFFEKCPKDLGCTIVLRGGDIEILEKVKRIADLMVFVVYNLKLETALIIDKFAKTPDFIELVSNEDYFSSKCDELNPLKLYETTILSVSPFIKFPPPYLLTRMKQAEQKLSDLVQKRNWHSTKDNDKQHSTSSSSVGLSGILRTPEQVIADAEFADAVQDHIFQVRAWETYEYNNVVSPYAHQNISVLFSKICTVNLTPCSEPEILVMEYYRESDRTLGQYLEEMSSRSAYLCSTCDRPLLMHYHSFCHGNSRITVYIDENIGHSHLSVDQIFMSTRCKQCGIETSPILMSEDTWKYSFGKYLELSVYQTEVRSRLEKCSHNVFRDHELYFHLNKHTIRFQHEPIQLLEVYAPPMNLYTKPEVHIRLKNQDLDTIRNKITKYWDSVADRIKNFNYETVQPDKVEMCKQELLEMSRRVVIEKKYMLQKLQQTYVNSPPEDTLALNDVLCVLQDKVMAWEKDFNDIARQYFRLTAKQIRRFFVDNHEAITLRGYSSSFLDLPLISMDLDTTPSDPSKSDKSDKSDDNIGPTIIPKLGSSPTEDLILSGLKEDFFLEGEYESLENDIEKVASQLTLFPFMDPKVSRRLSMKWMQEFKSYQRQCRAASELIFPAISDKQEEYDFTQPTEIPRIVPSTIKQRHPAASSLFASSDSRNSTGRSSNRQSRILSSSTSTKSLSSPSSSSSSSSSYQISMLQSVLEKGKESSSQEYSSIKRAQVHSRRNPSTSSEKSGIPRQNSKYSKPSSFKHTPDSYGLSAIRSHENKKSKLLYKPKRNRPTILPSKPTIEVFNNTKDATAEESDSSDEGVDDDHDQFYDDETRIFSLNRTDAFDELLGNEDFSLLPGREPSDESYIHHPALTFLGNDFNEPTTPVSESFSGAGRYLLQSDTNDNSNMQRIVRSFTNFWTDKKNLDPLVYPLNPTEHVFSDSSIIVREDEPGSIIAFALSSKEYLEKLKTMQQTNQNNDTSDDRFSSKSAKSANLVADGDENNDVEDNLLSHMKYQFSGNSTNFVCKIYCADQFDSLRRKCGCESTYIQSLSRCIKWDSSGGKSGSAFLKTRDDRLVMKQISRNEVDAFLKFAPKYFEYMSKALVDLPTVLTKIFGFYRIGYKNEQTGKNININFIVMENLFYERKVSKIFDLKGSMRNRHVQSTGKENEVLLDENLLELIMNENPIYLREHSKKLLYESLHNDTLFLAKHNVMDYSLLVGIDDEKHELVVGILDFIRTFTWDKKLESWVKESGFLGGGGKEPTIVTPRQYKNRFREAMNRYFLMVPDRWIDYKPYRRAGRIN